jgi:hypothetical protein
MKFPFFKNSDPLSSIGYKSDQQGIIKRYLREKTNWQDHLNRSSDYIRRFCDQIPSDSTIAILGSGWMLDLPLEYLVNKFKLIYMVDVLHPVQIKHRLKDKENVIFIEKDLTGYASDVSRIVHNSQITGIMDSLINLPTRNVLSDLRYDVILSVNILTQLDSLLCDFITSKFFLPSDHLILFQKKLQQEHLNLLASRPSCLISDVKEVFTYRNNSIAFVTDSLKVDWPAGKHSESWNWVFDSNYSYHPRYKTNLSVKAEMLF